MILRITVRACLAALVLAGCGDEEGGGGGAAKPAQPAAQRPAAARPGATATSSQQLAAYRQVESLAADEKEAKSLRHQFRETDFQVDPTGTVNRDPFRSYVINQPGVSSTDTTLTAQPTELCPAKRQIANTYMARELKLVGIVARGTERTALFSDTAQKGHLVKRNDCIGKEKGRVVEIGAAYAKAEISADPLPGQPPRPPDIIIYQLYPEQLPINPDDTSAGPAPKGS